MKNIRLFALVSSAICLSAMALASDGGPITAPIASTTSLYKPIDVKVDQGLTFGFVALPRATADAYTYVMDPTGAIACNGAGSHAFGTATAGQFTISGEENQIVTWSISDATDTDLTLSSWTYDRVPGTATLGEVDGKLVVKVGGTLTVPNTAAHGMHTLNGTLSVNYVG